MDKERLRSWINQLIDEIDAAKRNLDRLENRKQLLEKLLDERSNDKELDKREVSGQRLHPHCRCNECYKAFFDDEILENNNG